LKKRNLSLAIILFSLVSLLFLPPFVAAKPRKSYITDFIIENRISKSEGFTNSIDEQIISFEATFYSLEILSSYGLITQEVDVSGLQTTLREDLTDMLNSEEVSQYDLFYILSSLEILGYESTPDGAIESYLNQTEIATGGFAYTNTSSSSTLISTYFAVRNYQLIGIEIPNKTLHLNWILMCNNSDGGFGGKISLNSTLLNTFYAILSIDILDESTTLPDSSATISYTQSYYSILGGYVPDISSSSPLLSSTHSAVNIISSINLNAYNDRTATINWILDRQNVIDGGFSDAYNTLQEQRSSVSSTYLAYESLNTLNALGYLDQQFGSVEFNWFILLGLLVGIGIIIGLGFYLWNKRKL
jgi:prenyltransferase beta subunit